LKLRGKGRELGEITTAIHRPKKRSKALEIKVKAGAKKGSQGWSAKKKRQGKTLKNEGGLNQGCGPDMEKGRSPKEQATTRKQKNKSNKNKGRAGGPPEQ